MAHNVRRTLYILYYYVMSPLLPYSAFLSISFIMVSGWHKSFSKEITLLCIFFLYKTKTYYIHFFLAIYFESKGLTEIFFKYTFLCTIFSHFGWFDRCVVWVGATNMWTMPLHRAIFIKRPHVSVCSRERKQNTHTHTHAIDIIERLFSHLHHAAQKCSREITTYVIIKTVTIYTRKININLYINTHTHTYWL